MGGLHIGADFGIGQASCCDGVLSLDEIEPEPMLR